MKELESRGTLIELLHFSQPKWMPSWIKFPYYNFQVCRAKGDDNLLFSNDRLVCIEIYRAGGGVHKAFLKRKGFTLNPLHLVYLYLEKRSFENSKAIISISDMVKREIIENYRVEPQKITTIYNGVEIKSVSERLMRESREEIFREFGINIEEDRGVILYVGNGFKRKGVREFLHILSKVKTPFYAFVVGNDSRISKYKRVSRELGLGESVIFTGSREDVDRFYMSSDIFLFPTHYEPFGNVVLEAMSFFNLIITTRQCGAGEILEGVPLMKSPNDFEIANFIDEVLKDREKLNRLKSRNREIAKHYSIQNNAKKTIDLIKKVQSENFSD
jgi:UDP-glucose:(heptosyl)LPS alpha-1,3-glucosyltransferase